LVATIRSVFLGDDHEAYVPRTRFTTRAPRLRGRSLAQLGGDQVREHLGVRLGVEDVALRLQLGLQLEVVLDDAVVHHRDAFVRVRVRVLVRRRPCVAQRVWPMPTLPSIGVTCSRASRFFSLPVARTTCSLPALITASPAES